MQMEVWEPTRQGLCARMEHVDYNILQARAAKLVARGMILTTDMFPLADFKSQISHQCLKPDEFTLKFSFLARAVSRDLATLSPSSQLVNRNSPAGPEPHHLPVWLISTMLNKRICWALWASAFANLAGLQAALVGYPLAHAEKRGEMVSKKLISLSASEPSPDHKEAEESARLRLIRF